jgi:hypothetical protein
LCNPTHVSDLTACPCFVSYRMRCHAARGRATARGKGRVRGPRGVRPGSELLGGTCSASPFATPALALPCHMIDSTVAPHKNQKPATAISSTANTHTPHPPTLEVGRQRPRDGHNPLEGVLNRHTQSKTPKSAAESDRSHPALVAVPGGAHRSRAPAGGRRCARQAIQELRGGSACAPGVCCCPPGPLCAPRASRLCPCTHGAARAIIAQPTRSRCLLSRKPAVGALHACCAATAARTAARQRARRPTLSREGSHGAARPFRRILCRGAVCRPRQQRPRGGFLLMGQGWRGRRADSSREGRQPCAAAREGALACQRMPHRCRRNPPEALILRHFILLSTRLSLLQYTGPLLMVGFSVIIGCFFMATLTKVCAMHCITAARCITAGCCPCVSA